MIRELFLEGMSRAACTVSVVTTDGHAGRAGITVSAMCSVSADTPTPSLLVCVHRESETNRAIRENGTFCVNVLRDEHAFISDTFAGRTSVSGEAKFACAEWTRGQSGAPLLVNALVSFECELKNTLEWGSHHVLIGELLDIEVNDQASPLIYANRAYGTPAPLVVQSDASGSSAGGHLDVGCFLTLEPYFLPRLLAAFDATHPGTSVRVLEGNQEELVARLRSHEIEAALTYRSELPDDLVCEVLGEVAPYVLMSPDHALAKSARVSLRDLAREPMVLLDVPPSRAYFTSLFQMHGVEPNVVQRSASFETVRGLVAHGLGFTLLATKPANNVSYDGRALVTRTLSESVPPSEVVIACDGEIAAGSMLDDFAGHCRGLFR